MTVTAHFDDLNELEKVQNSALGAYCLWQFGLAYQDEAPNAPHLPLHFLVLPLLFHHTSLDHLVSTRSSSGLALFAAKLGDRQEDLLAVHERVRALRELTLASIGLAVSRGICTLDDTTASLRSNTVSTKKLDVPERLKPLTAGSKKLGVWFARLELAQIALVLRVMF